MQLLKLLLMPFKKQKTRLFKKQRTENLQELLLKRKLLPKSWKEEEKQLLFWLNNKQMLLTKPEETNKRELQNLLEQTDWQGKQQKTQQDKLKQNN